MTSLLFMTLGLNGWARMSKCEYATIILSWYQCSRGWEWSAGGRGGGMRETDRLGREKDLSDPSH